MNVAICRLCGESCELRRSHIVPEFLWKKLYDENHTLYGITGNGPHGFKTLQKGLRERLFCDDCEQFFNDSIERPFKKEWIDNCPLPKNWNGKELLTVKVNYATVKLFHLSVLFRAHVSTLEDFEAVNLGPHAERIRRMLKGMDPCSANTYPISGYAIVHPESRELLPILSSAQAIRIDGAQFYGIMYGGMDWWTCISSHRVPKFEELSIRTDGTMLVGAVSMAEIGSIQEVSRKYSRYRK